MYALYFSVLMLHEQAAPAVTSMPSTSIARRSPTSVLLQEQRDENGLLLHMFKEDITPRVRLLLYIRTAYKLGHLNCICILNLWLPVDF